MGGDDADYDLLLACLSSEGWTNANALANNYFVTGPSDWETVLGQEIDNALKAGGQVFLSNFVFTPSAYENMSNEGPFSAFSTESFKTIQGPSLYERVSRFFSAYERSPSELQLGGDRFWVIRERKDPNESGRKKPLRPKTR